MRFVNVFKKKLNTVVYDGALSCYEEFKLESEHFCEI